MESDSLLPWIRKRHPMAKSVPPLAVLVVVSFVTDVVLRHAFKRYKIGLAFLETINRSNTAIMTRTKPVMGRPRHNQEL